MAGGVFGYRVGNLMASDLRARTRILSSSTINEFLDSNPPQAILIGTRFAALVLFVFNIVAVISYPDLGAVGLRDHQIWGLLLLITLLHGPGKLSFDHLIERRFAGR